jgi:hypothetical protein
VGTGFSLPVGGRGTAAPRHRVVQLNSSFSAKTNSRENPEKNLAPPTHDPPNQISLGTGWGNVRKMYKFGQKTSNLCLYLNIFAYKTAMFSIFLERHVLATFFTKYLSVFAILARVFL